jgi:hypothetical protein
MLDWVTKNLGKHAIWPDRRFVPRYDPLDLRPAS